MPQGYDGLPALYLTQGSPMTPNLGLSLQGCDPLVAENFWLIDVFAGGGGGTSVFVNTVSVTNPNFNDTTPAAAPGFLNVTWHVSGSDVSASIDTSSITATPAGNTNDIQFNNGGVFDATDNFAWDVTGAQGINVVTTQEGAFFTVDNGGVDVQLLGIGVEVDISGAVTNTSTALNVFTSVALGASINNVEGLTIGCSVNGGPGTSVGQYLGLDISGPATANVNQVIGLRLGNFNLAADATNSRAVQILDGNIEFASGTALLAGNTFVDPTDQTRGFLLNFGNITSGNIWNVNIPDADSSTAQSASVTANQSLSGFNVTNGTFSYVAIAQTATVTAGQALVSYDAITGLFTKAAYGTGTVTSVGLATGSGATDALYTITGSPVTSSGTITETLNTQTANTVFAGPTSGGAATPTFRALVAADIPNSTVTPLWSNLQNAAADLTLANAGFNTTFNQTSAVNWTWANTTAASSGTSQSSPIFNINGKYWDGAASQTDSWTIQNVVANGTNGTSRLTFTHSGTTGQAALVLPAGTTSFPSLQFSGANAGTGISAAANGNFLSLNTNAAAGGGVQLAASATIYGTLTSDNAGGLVVSGGNASFAINRLTLVGRNGSTINTSHILMGGAAGVTQIATSGTSVGIQIGGPASNTNGQLIFAPTSGTANFVGVNINPTINQTSTSSGNYTALQVNVVETSLKGSANLLLDLQAGTTGGTSEFAVNNVGVVSKYAATTTVRQGIPSEIGTAVDSTAQSAAITATNIIASAPRTGMYRISWSATITTAASTSSVLGGTNGFQVGFTSPTDSVAKTVVPGNSTTSAANTTATAVAGSYVVYAKTGTAITYAFDYTSVGVTAMVYELHVALEAL